MRRWPQSAGPVRSRRTLGQDLIHSLQEGRARRPVAYKNLPRHCLSFCLCVCVCMRARQLHYTTIRVGGFRLKPSSAIFSRLRADRTPKSRVPAPVQEVSGLVSRLNPGSGPAGDSDGGESCGHSATTGRDERPVRLRASNNKPHPAGAARSRIPAFSLSDSTFSGREGRQRRL